MPDARIKRLRRYTAPKNDYYVSELKADITHLLKRYDSVTANLNRVLVIEEKLWEEIKELRQVIETLEENPQIRVSSSPESVKFIVSGEPCTIRLPIATPDAGFYIELVHNGKDGGEYIVEIGQPEIVRSP